MRKCWLRDVGLQINTNTTRSRAWKFLKFVFRCSVLVPNRWMWSSEHIIVGCFWISQHPQLNFLLVEETLPLWQTKTAAFGLALETHPLIDIFRRFSHLLIGQLQWPLHHLIPLWRLHYPENPERRVLNFTETLSGKSRQEWIFDR